MLTVVVVCVASLSNEKDHETLLRAWQQVEQHCPQARLRLIGEGPLRAELAALIASLKLRQVELPGEMPAVGAFANASLAVLTSREEGLGSAICLAQAMGIAAVVTDAGGLPEAIDDGRTGIVAPVGDPDAIGDAIVRLLRDDGMRARFGLAAADRAAVQFDPARIAAAHVDVYESVLSGR